MAEEDFNKQNRIAVGSRTIKFNGSSKAENQLKPNPLGDENVGKAGSRSSFEYSGVALPSSLVIASSTLHTFISIWDSTIVELGHSPADTIVLPMSAGFLVDWGDGSTSYTNRHVYAVGGQYEIKIYGDILDFRFNLEGDYGKLLDVTKWGGSVWSTMNGAFRGCENMQITAGDLPNTGSVVDFSNAFARCSAMTSFPLIDTSSATTLAAAWVLCSALTSFPLIDTSSVTDLTDAWGSNTLLASFPFIDTSSAATLTSAWSLCSALTSIPLLDTSSVTDFNFTWFFCGLTSFPLLDTSSGVNFDSAFMFSFGLNGSAVPAFDLQNMTNGENMFNAVTFTTTSWSDLLIATEASNSNSDVVWNGGGSKHNASGATALDALEADHSWTIADGGPA